MRLGIASVLTIIFVVAKILGLLNWSWIWVFAPLWLALAVAAIGAMILGLIVYFSDRC